jgi:hypothetical protein
MGMISSTIPSTKYSCSGSPVMLTKATRQSTVCRGAEDRCPAASSPGRGRDQPVDTHRSRDVFELLLTDVFEGKVELARGIFLDPRRDADATWYCQSLQPGRDIHSVAENVTALDRNVSHIDEPIRNSMRFSADTAALRWAIPACTSDAQRSACTTLLNSASSPSPVVLTSRPLCAAIVGSISSTRTAPQRLESAPLVRPISRE